MIISFTGCDGAGKTTPSIAKVNSGRSIPKAEVTLANSQAEVTLANFYISVLFHAIV